MTLQIIILIYIVGIPAHYALVRFIYHKNNFFWGNVEMRKWMLWSLLSWLSVLISSMAYIAFYIIKKYSQDNKT